MDLKSYGQIKFALAEHVRSGQLIATERETDSKKKHDAEQPWRNLLVRLADDRFTVVFAGRFNRGKSSLMNALLGMDRLPTGVVPSTSVITYVRYGTASEDWAFVLSKPSIFVPASYYLFLEYEAHPHWPMTQQMQEKVASCVGSFCQLAVILAC